MGKLLNFLDNYALKFCVCFLIFFVALYPKLPSIHIVHTWVYIRLEDFAISAAVAIWILTLLRRKAKFLVFLGLPIFTYWIFGFISLVFSLVFIGPLLVNFFPSIAILSYLRRIEYMFLFFVAFSSVKSVKDVRDYIMVFTLTSLTFSIYAIGQKFYLYIWNILPGFFAKHPFCFPSYQTGNEEFAKGIPLCLPFDGRITSTFAGHYDLAAYLVLMIPIFLAVIFTLRRRLYKVLFSGFTLLTIIILILTASRISFPAYLVGSAITLSLIKKKKFIIPLIIISMILLPIFSSSVLKRFAQTFRVASIVIDNQGNLVGEVGKEKQIIGNVPTQNLPSGTGYIGLPEEKKTDTALVRTNLTAEEARRLKLENGGVELTAVKGNFTIKKALVYDISLTTRLQSEWPRAIKAFSKNIFLGSGFSTITLATDNDLLRALGETGLLGLTSFLSIFLFLFVLFKKTFSQLKDPLVRALGAGVIGGVVGLFLNASMYDIFESSKVAETLWMLLGITASLFILSRKEKLNYPKELKAVLTSTPFLILYLSVAGIAFFSRSFNNFFVADDFTWLKWAATSNLTDLLKGFVSASGFFYRPIDKIVMFFLYALFAFKPQGYHAFMILMHIFTAVGVYLLGIRLLKNKAMAFMSSLIFLFYPIHSENVFWIATISTNLSTLFIVYGLWLFTYFRERKSLVAYLATTFLFGLSLFTYENAGIFIVLVFLLDLIIYSLKRKMLAAYIPYVILIGFYFYMRNLSGALGLNGDYSYNLLHLLPNIAGNLFGYFSTLIFGEWALPLYNFLRGSLRSDALIAAPILGIFLFFVFLYFYRRRALVKRYVQNYNVRLIIFGFLFAIGALIPFLGLGNLSPRYTYLPSIGFSLILPVLIFFLVDRFSTKANKKYVLWGVSFLVGIFLLGQLWSNMNQWEKAAKITNRSLTYLKIYHEKVPQKSSLYFVNVPIRYQNAWVFPVGLPEAIWFLYRDESINVKKASNVGEAKALKVYEKNKAYIFEFKDFTMEEVK